MRVQNYVMPVREHNTKYLPTGPTDLLISKEGLLSRLAKKLSIDFLSIILMNK